MFIDPLHANSLIAYKIMKNGLYFEAEMTISDCNRMANWSFDETPEALDKIDNAINMMMTFRKELVKGAKDYIKRKKVEDEALKKK